MAGCVRDLLNIPECSCLKVVAGQNGLNRSIRWTSAIEVTDILKFSNEGDLNFVTGIMLLTEDDILAFVREAFKYKLAGIVFAPGPYIESIPQSVVEFADANDFPILTMPWDIKISSLSHIVGEHIYSEPDQKRMPSDVLKMILEGGATPDMETQLKRMGFDECTAYRVLVLRIVSKEIISSGNLNDIYGKLTDGINCFNFNKAYSVRMPSQVAVVLLDEGARKIAEEKMTSRVCQMAAKVQVLYDDLLIRVGIGSCYESSDKIRDSFNEAILVTSLLPHATQHRKALYRYDQLGAYRVVWESRNPKAMLDFSESTIGPLMNYDEVNKTDLMKFIGAYFEYNGNIRDLSDRLYIHKNTVRYKISKIEDILDRSIDDMETVLDLLLALKIRDVFVGRD